MDKRNRMEPEEQQRLKEKIMQRENLRKELFRHIKSLNRHLTDIILMEMSVWRLLRLCHPLYRLDYAKKLEKLDMIEEESLSKIERDAHILMKEGDFHFGLYSLS